MPPPLKLSIFPLTFVEYFVNLWTSLIKIAHRDHSNRGVRTNYIPHLGATVNWKLLWAIKRNSKVYGHLKLSINFEHSWNDIETKLVFILTLRLTVCITKFHCQVISIHAFGDDFVAIGLNMEFNEYCCPSSVAG